MNQMDASSLKIGICVARFNEFITKSLLEGAVSTLARHGASKENITVLWVPGAFELPLAAQHLAEQNDAVVCLGAVIRGATSHYDLVCNQAASGIMKVGLEKHKPVIFGVITTDTIEQAIERAGTKAGNKGAEAALAAIEMVHLLRK